MAFTTLDNVTAEALLGVVGSFTFQNQVSCLISHNSDVAERCRRHISRSLTAVLLLVGFQLGLPGMRSSPYTLGALVLLSQIRWAGCMATEEASVPAPISFQPSNYWYGYR